jgi:Mu transposase, C-terminal./Integrase core domain.
VFGRFEAENPNDRWTGDALHGPQLGGRKVYLFAFLDDHSRLITGYRFGYAEDTVRLGVALQPALASRGVPGSVYVDNGSAFVDAWLLRACAKLGVRLVHSTPHRPQGRGKIERFFRTVREQFLVEVADTTVADLADAGTDHAAALLELNRLFTAWVETEYHRRTHSETGQTPLDRWDAGWARLGRPPAMPTVPDLTEAFLWSEYRTVTKTATVSLHSNTYQVEPALVGRKVELVFSPFDLQTIEVRYCGKSFGTALPHNITRHTHPKARPETGEPVPPPPTGIDYLNLTAQAHHEHVRGDQRIGFHALFGTDTDTDDSDQVPGQLSLTDIIQNTTDDREATA